MNVQTMLYGFAFSNDNIIFDKNDLNIEKLDFNDAFVYVNRNDSQISLYQDFGGCYGLYLHHHVTEDLTALIGF